MDLWSKKGTGSVKLLTYVEIGLQGTKIHKLRLIKHIDSSTNFGTGLVSNLL